MNQKNNLNLPRIIGHRGVKNLAPENTIESILEAIRLGLKWIEVDVKISKDGIPFLLHDDNLDRTTNGSGLGLDNLVIVNCSIPAFTSLLQGRGLFIYGLILTLQL